MPTKKEMEPATMKSEQGVNYYDLMRSYSIMRWLFMSHFILNPRTYKGRGGVDATPPKNFEFSPRG